MKNKCVKLLRAEADILCLCRTLFHRSAVLFSLVLLLKHKMCFSSCRAVILGMQGALSVLLLPLV